MLASYLFFYLFTYKDGDILYWWKDKQILVSLELEKRTPITIVSGRTLEDEKRLNREHMKKITISQHEASDTEMVAESV